SAGSGAVTCALLESGNVRCWGVGTFGALGYGKPDIIGDDEFPATQGNVNIGASAVQVAASSHTCAVLATGAVRCWGPGAQGALGYGNTITIGDDETPAAAGDVNVGGRVVRVAVGYQRSCALLSTGNVRCWGDGREGALGYGNLRTIGDDEAPATAGDLNIGGSVVQVAMGLKHTCALLSRGNVRCWGLNSSGELGYGNRATIGDDDAAGAGGDVNVGGSVVQIAAGNEHTCAVLSNGRLRCWGNNYYSQLGHPGPDPIGDDETPASAGDVPIDGVVQKVAAGGGHTCVLLASGSVRCWGDGEWGQLGYGNRRVMTAPAVGDVNVGGSVVNLITGHFHTCAILASGALRCWGANSFGAFGQLGYPDVIMIGDDELPYTALDVAVQ
ncbi:MAG TPA: hypothetical protein VK524_12565, partial [Polyangiaceae bacterium]|nr:hypothetical protein [Polyangiaceae bacterium]